jgi:hypothetical protein
VCYDITLTQRNFTIIRESSGLCVHNSDSCVLEFPAAYRDLNRKRNQLSVRNPTPEQTFVSGHATEICDKYLQAARQSAVQLSLSSISQSTEDAAMTACINDLELSGQRQVSIHLNNE